VANVLVIEDEESLLHTLRYNLTRAGHEVRLCTNGSKGLEMAFENPPDLLLLDLMLPGLDGLEICRRIRQEIGNPTLNRVPILILTARDEEIDKVVGLEVGADDYLTKPFSMHELLARVKALLRRADMTAPVQTAPARLVSGDLVMEVGARRVLRDGQELRLRPREFDLLAYLLRYRGQVLGRERILRNVWGYESPGDTRTIDVHVRWLRGKIEDDPTNPTRLQTVRGVGYMLAE
jgi:two-component system alkaline phosphatase synthesis response regulator PhoP